MISESETLILTLIFSTPSAKYVAQLCFFHRVKYFPLYFSYDLAYSISFSYTVKVEYASRYLMVSHYEYIY